MKTQKRLLVALTIGLGVTGCGIVFLAFLRLVYEHNALGSRAQIISMYVIHFTELPCLLLSKLNVYYGIDEFNNSHVQGSDFWFSLLLYMVVNSACWMFLLVLIFPLLQRLRTRSMPARTAD